MLIRSEGTRLLGVLWLLAAAALAVAAWRDDRWSVAIGVETGRPTLLRRARLAAFVGISLSAAVVLVANLALVADPGEPFGTAGYLWLAGIGLLVASAYAWDRGGAVQATEANEESRWPRWELVVFASIVILSFALRVWDLRSFPNNIYPDEIMTGQVASDAYLSSQAPPSLFSTLWGGIDLPALWFFIVSRFQMAAGSTLDVLRLPGALFGAATVVPFYLVVRGVWGRWAAIGGATILAASASNVHYSRLALNNIVAPFFWTLCFFFLLRAMRGRKGLDWALAGLSAGISEHFYNGTRLLPLVLLGYLVFLLVVHWRQIKTVLAGYVVLALGYLAGFGPLLAHFLTNPGLYFGRGTEMLVWKGGIPASLEEVGQMWATFAPIIGENLLGFSTVPSQDIIYFGPLLLVPEAALLVLGVALLVWKWKHPAASLMLLSGIGTLFVGGTLIGYPNSVFPLINHWTPAFPAIYAAIAIAVGSLARSLAAIWREGDRKLLPVAFGASLAALVIWNAAFYFAGYRADAASLKSESYRRAQEYYDVQTAQSRYIASIGTGYRVIWVGQSAQPYDAGFTHALLGKNEDGVRLASPERELATLDTQGKGLAFILFPENGEYRALIEGRYPGGRWGEVRGPTGNQLFATYEIVP